VRRRQPQASGAPLPPHLASGPAAEDDRTQRRWQADCARWARENGHPDWIRLLPEPIRLRYAPEPIRRYAPTAPERFRQLPPGGAA